MRHTSAKATGSPFVASRTRSFKTNGKTIQVLAEANKICSGTDDKVVINGCEFTVQSVDDAFASKAITKFAATHNIPKAINELDIIDLEYSG